MEAKSTATVIPILMNESTTKHSPLKLNRLLQLCSANLPVGGFSFSQGLEYAVEMGWVNNPESTKEWISFNLNQSIAYTDLALLNRLQKALVEDDFERFHTWNQHALACRESNELYLADVAMGKALMRLLKDIKNIDSQHYVQLIREKHISFVSAFALSAHLFGLELSEMQSGFCWAYIDNQVAAARSNSSAKFVI